MENKFIKGTRVKISAEGIEHSIHRVKWPDMQGVVVGKSRTVDCVVVLWDGLKTRESVHASFLEIVPEEQKPLQTE